MPHQQNSRAATVRPRRTSSLERHQRASAKLSSTRDVDEQRGELRRIRSFTTRSGTVVNRGDLFEVRGAAAAGAGGSESTRRRRRDPRGVVEDGAAVDGVLPQRLPTAATGSRHRVVADYDCATTSVVQGGANCIASTDALYTVMVMGSDSVGKTTITQQLLTSEYLANKDYNFG